jgi:hypothetical protein
MTIYMIIMYATQTELRKMFKGMEVFQYAD